jgi:hypothetical protein
MNDEALRAFAVALFGTDSASALDLAKGRAEILEDYGFTVYKKKVFMNGRRPSTSHTMTDELKDKIRRTYRANPRLTMHEIAAMYGVNHGRVSEAISGQ